MAARLYIDGIDFSDDIDGLDDSSLAIKTTKSKVTSYTFSTELIFTRDAFKLIKRTFFDNPCEGRKSKIDTVLYIDCCDEEDNLEFVIDYEGVAIDFEECTAEVTLKSKNKCQDAYEYLRDVPYFKNGFDEIQSPKVRYCVQVNNFTAMLFLAQFLSPILIFLEIIEEVVNGIISLLKKIIKAFSWLFGGASILTNINFEVDIFSMDNFMAYLTGAGNYHFAPYIKDIFDHNISKASTAGCNLSYDFPLLETQPYSELALFQAINKKGLNCDATWVKFYEKSAYNVTTLQLAEQLAEVFNLTVLLTSDGVLRIDDYDNLVNSAEVAFNAEAEFYKGNSEEFPRYRFTDDGFCQVVNYKYGEDATDIEGNRLLYPEYSEAIVFDDSSNGTGDSCTKEFKFGAARFMFDTESAVKDEYWDDDLKIDKMRSKQINIPPFNFNFDDLACLPRDRDLIMKEHTASLPKLLVLEPNTELNDAKVVRKKISSNSGHDFYIYNYPMHLQREADYQELIKGFHYKDDPSYEGSRVIEMDDYTISLTSTLLNQIKEYGNYISVESRYGLALPKEIIINLGNCTATFKGLIYRCG